MKNKRFWLVVACLMLAVLWYCLLLICFLGLNILTDKVLTEHPGVFYVVLSIAGVAILFIASALAMPFAIWAFKKLKVQAPVLSSVALFMALVFGSTLSSFLLGFGFYQQDTVYIVLAVSAVVAILVYAFFIRRLKHTLSAKKFLFVSIGLAVLPLVFYAVHQAWIYSTLN